MATNKEIKKNLKVALKEIGEIQPWFEKDVNAWVFEHSNYPVSYAGKNAKEVIEKYPLHLKEFIIERLANNLDPLVEKKTKGYGGARKGAGRPRGSIKEPTIQVRLPTDIAKWLKYPGMIPHVRSIIQASKHI